MQEYIVADRLIWTGRLHSQLPRMSITLQGSQSASDGCWDPGCVQVNQNLASQQSRTLQHSVSVDSNGCGKCISQFVVHLVRDCCFDLLDKQGMSCLQF